MPELDLIHHNAEPNSPGEYWFFCNPYLNWTVSQDFPTREEALTARRENKLIWE